MYLENEPLTSIREDVTISAYVAKPITMNENRFQFVLLQVQLNS